MIWEILFGLYLLGAAITFIYIGGKGIKACIRAAFGLSPQYKIWAPFKWSRRIVLGDIGNDCDWGLGLLASCGIGLMYAAIYPVYLPAYAIKKRIKYWLYKMVATKEEQVQRALGTDRPEKDDTSQIQRLQAILGSHKKSYGSQLPQQAWDKGNFNWNKK